MSDPNTTVSTLVKQGVDLASVPSGFTALYIVAAFAAVLVGAALAKHRRTPTRRRRLVGLSIVVMLLSAAIFQIVQDTLLIEYKDQGIEFNGQTVVKNLIVPIPASWVRTANFFRYAPGQPLFERTPGVEMRRIVFEQSNVYGTYLTVGIHLFSSFLILLCLSFLIFNLKRGSKGDEAR